MFRISALRNHPIIFRNKQIGFLQSVSLDYSQKKVRAFIVSRGIRGKCAVLPEHVQSISDRFILVDQLDRYERVYENGVCRFVRDTTGLLIGQITDYALHENLMKIYAIEIIPGFLPPENKIRLWIYTYQRHSTHALTVPALLCEEPTIAGEDM